jgi:hypothetical protein
MTSFMRVPLFKTFSASLLMLLTTIALAQSQPTTSTPVAATTTRAATTQSFPVHPFSIRGGIGNVAAKLKAGNTITVAFLGGPITFAGTGRGYAAQIVQWLQLQHPAATIRVIHAGSVDGGSVFGAARFDRDISPHKPDLLFVEFAADDVGREDRTWYAERIVHRAWTSNPTTDIVMLYAIEESQRADYAAGHLPPTAAAYEKIAEHYGIPSIGMGVDIISRIQANKARWGDFFYDAARPTPMGHGAYANAVTTALRAMLADESAKVASPHELKNPIAGNQNPLRPTSRRATTMPAPPAMTDGSGNTARETFVMPLVGTQWVGSPEYADASGRVLWRLFTQPVSENGRRLSDTFGLDRSKWGPPMQWFEDWRMFTGPAGVYLVHCVNDAKANNLTARENDLPILTFTAPKAGRYVVRLKAAEAAVWGLHNQIVLNVVHFPAGQAKGKSIAFHRTQRGALQAPNIEVEVRMNEGDDLAFELDTNATGGGGGAVYREADLSIGWFGE